MRGRFRMKDYAQALSFPPHVFRGRAVKSILSQSAPDECGAFSLLPFATEAKGSGTPTGVGNNLRTGRVRRRPHPMGWEGAARLSASHRGSRRGDLRHPRRNPGHVSWDAVWPVLPTFACPSPASTSRAGRNAGRHDTQAARERAVSSRPRAPHSLRLSEYLRERRPVSERASTR